MLNVGITARLVPILLARIIHQPEKSTGEGDCMVQMSHKTTVSQAHDAPATISSGRPDTTPIGRIDASERTASCPLLGPTSMAWHV